MSKMLSRGAELGLEPVKGEGWIHFRFHGGPQTRVNRVVLLGSGTFVELQKGVEELLGSQSGAVFYDAGIRAGRESRETLEKEFEEKGDKFFVKAFSILEEFGLGWFKVESLRVNEENRRGSVTVSKCFIADTYGKSEEPICHFVAGFIAGVMSVLWDVDVVCSEVVCSSVEGNVCVFEWEEIQ